MAESGEWADSLKEGLGGKAYFGSRSGGGNDASTSLANKHGLALDIYSVTANVRVAFKAFLTSFKDSFDAQLETQMFVGHPQPLRRQKAVDRSVAIGLDIPAHSVDEAKLNLRNIALFTKMLYPVAQSIKSDLSGVPDQTQIMAGGDPQFKIRFMNLLIDGTTATLENNSTNFASAKESGVTGYVDNLSYEFDLDSGFLTDWGKTPTGSRPKRPKRFDNFAYPRLIKLSFVFYPLMERSPVWIYGEEGERTFTNGSFPYAYKGVKTTSAGAPLENSFQGRGNLSNKTINSADQARMNKALGS